MLKALLGARVARVKYGERWEKVGGKFRGLLQESEVTVVCRKSPEGIGRTNDHNLTSIKKRESKVKDSGSHAESIPSVRDMGPRQRSVKRFVTSPEKGNGDAGLRA